MMLHTTIASRTARNNKAATAKAIRKNRSEESTFGAGVVVVIRAGVLRKTDTSFAHEP